MGFQKCPVCNGNGTKHTIHSLSEVKCNTCNGTGIINEVTGLPPGGASVIPGKINTYPNIDKTPPSPDENEFYDRLINYRRHPYNPPYTITCTDPNCCQHNMEKGEEAFTEAVHGLYKSK